MPVTETEIAWAAGFFDGEGHTGFHSAGIKKGGSKNGQIRKRLVMKLGQKNIITLTRFAQVAGEGWVTRNSSKPEGMYEWTLNGEEGVKRVLEKLRPFLSEVKITQAEAALSAYGEYKLLNPPGRPKS